jgi:protein-tyrosine phosphatase
MKNLLMVCMGNICRSPMAQSIAQQLASDAGMARQLRFDSAGTHACHAGEPPDPRALATLVQHGYAAGAIRSRRIAPKDFQQFDLILAMDVQNMKELRRQCPAEYVHKLQLLLDFAPACNATEVPDPYYGNPEGFQRVLALCEAGARGLIEHLR